jgi:hypothetical protein
MRTAFSILLITLCHLALTGQSAEEEVIRLKQQQGVTQDVISKDAISMEGVSRDEADLRKDAKRGAWNLSAGTSYSYMTGYGSGMMFYAAPTFTMPLNNRWALHGGLIASQYQGMNASFAGESLWPSSFSSVALFAAASYQMSDRLVFHGTGVKQLITAPPSPFTPYPMDNLSMGATYKLGNNITIGATIHMNQGHGYYSTPFGGTRFHSPFYW